MASSEWKVTVHEVWRSRGAAQGTIRNTKEITTSPSESISSFVAKIGCKGATLRPFTSKEGPGGSDGGNCGWDVKKGKTIKEAGLCDGAVLCWTDPEMGD